MPDTHCTACGRAFPADAEYCSGCGRQRGTETPQTAKSGRDWVDTGGGDIKESFNVNDSFNVNNIAVDSGQIPTMMWRSTVRKLPVSEPPPWTAALGVVGSLASVIALVQGVLPYGITLASVVVFALLISWWASLRTCTGRDTYRSASSRTSQPSLPWKVTAKEASTTPRLRLSARAAPRRAGWTFGTMRRPIRGSSAAETLGCTACSSTTPRCRRSAQTSVCPARQCCAFSALSAWMWSVSGGVEAV
jgi:hypothetical protein